MAIIFRYVGKFVIYYFLTKSDILNWKDQVGDFNPQTILRFQKKKREREVKPSERDEDIAKTPADRGSEDTDLQEHPRVHVLPVIVTSH